MGQTTITLDDEVKERLEEQKDDGESWNSHLLSLLENSEGNGTEKVRLTDEDHERIQQGFKDIIEGLR